MRTAIIEREVMSTKLLPGTMIPRQFIARDDRCATKHCFRASSSLPFACLGLLDGCLLEHEPVPEATCTLVYAWPVQTTTAIPDGMIMIEQVTEWPYSHKPCLEAS